MDMVALAAQARSSDVSAHQVRHAGKVPCVVYGNEVKNTSLECDYNAIYKVYAKAGASTLVELDMAGKKVPVLFHEITFEPVTGRIAHVDFYAVNMKKEIETEVPIRITGISPAVRDEAGVLVLVHDHLTVRCLPADLPHDIEVNVDSLAKFDDHIKVSEVKLPKGVTVTESPDEVVVTVQEPRKEEVIAPVVAEGVPAEGEAAAAAGTEAAAAGAPEKAEKKAPEKKESKKE